MADDGDYNYGDASVYCGENISEKGRSGGGSVFVYYDNGCDICVGGVDEISGRRMMSDGSVREKDPNDLELPLGKRTKLYRVFEILPGFLSYGMIILLFLLSWLSPTVGSIYLLAIITMTLVKAIGIAVRTLQGYNGLQSAMKVDWHQRLMDLEDAHEKYEELREVKSEEFGFLEHVDNLRRVSANEKAYPKSKDIMHAVIMTAYNEELETMRPSIEAVVNQTFPYLRFSLGWSTNDIH